MYIGATLALLIFLQVTPHKLLHLVATVNVSESSCAGYIYCILKCQVSERHFWYLVV